MDVEFPDTPAGAPVNERWRGTFAFSGPASSWPGYDVSNVQVTGTLAGRRIDMNGRGGGVWRHRDGARLHRHSFGQYIPLSYDLRGTADRRESAEPARQQSRRRT